MTLRRPDRERKKNNKKPRATLIVIASIRPLERRGTGLDGLDYQLKPNPTPNRYFPAALDHFHIYMNERTNGATCSFLS